MASPILSHVQATYVSAKICANHRVLCETSYISFGKSGNLDEFGSNDPARTIIMF